MFGARDVNNVGCGGAMGQGLIPEDIIRQVLDRADIVEVISAYFPLRPAGRNFKALSPFRHEKTPSFVVSPDKQIFHCFSTGIGGNAISFVMQMERVAFPEAVKILADRYGIVIPETGGRDGGQQKDARERLWQINALVVQYFHRNLLVDRAEASVQAREYLKGRGIDLEQVKRFQLGLATQAWDGLTTWLRSQNVEYAEMVTAGLVIPRRQKEGYFDRFRHRVMFPIFDVRGHCVAFGGRALDSAEEAKYLNSPETPVYVKGRHLYGLHLSKQAVTREDCIVIVEGYMDFVSPMAAGVDHVAASLGTALTADQIRLVRRYTQNVILLYDADPAGENAMNRSLDLLVEEGMHTRVARLPQGEDPDSFVRRFGAEAFRERVREAKDVAAFKLDFLMERHGGQTTADRARIAAEMLAFIQRLEDPIARTEAVTAVARRLSVVQNALMTEQALIAELGRLARQPQTQKGPVPEAERVESRSEPVKAAERELLSIVLSDGRFVPMVRGQLTPGDFSSKMIRGIFEAVFEMYDAQGGVDVAALVARVTDPGWNTFLSALAARDDAAPGDPDKVCADCIERIRQDQIKSRRRQIVVEMEAAKAAGDEQRVMSLVEDLNQILKR